MFGSNQTPGGGSLFGAKPASTGSSLFGSATTPAAPATGTSLFGSATTPAAPATGANLFGAKPSTTGSSLFGSAPAATPAVPATGASLFGAKPSTAGSSLFGGASATTSAAPAASTSLFGAKPAAPVAGSSLFGGALTTSSGQAQAQTQHQVQSLPADITSDIPVDWDRSSKWHTALERSSALVSHIPGGGVSSEVVNADRSARIDISTMGIPQLKRDSVQLKVAAMGLRSQSMVSASMENRMVRLLGQHDFDAEQLERQIHQIAPVYGHSSSATMYKDHHENVILSAVEEAMMATRAESDRQLNEVLVSDWNATKQELLKDLERDVSGGVWKPITMEASGVARVKASSATSAFPNGVSLHDKFSSPVVGGGLSPIVRDGSTRTFQFTPQASAAHKSFSSTAATAPASTQRFEGISGAFSPAAENKFTGKMSFYAKVMRELVVSKSAPGDIFDKFKDAAERCVGEPSVDVDSTVHTWELARSMLSNSYAEPSQGAREHLEREFLLFLERRTRYAATQGNQSTATPGLLSTVRRWLMLSLEDPLSGNGAIARYLSAASADPRDLSPEASDPAGNPVLPLWAVVYYCLRCGGWKTGAGLLKSACNANQLPESDLCIVPALSELAEDRNGRLSTESKQKLQALHEELQQDTSSSPWKRAVVYLLCADGATEADPVVSASIQDFMWLKLCVALNPNGGNYGVKDLATTISSMGPEYFRASQDPYMYARLLMMCGEFEDAVAFLSSQNKSPPCFVDAVHLTVAFLLLKKVKFSSATLNIGSLFLEYAQLFATEKPDLAALYLAFLKEDGMLIPSAHDALVALLLETKAYDELLHGMTEGVGTYNAYGVLCRVLESKECIALALKAAKCAVEYGLPGDAIALYRLCGREGDDEALLVLCKQLVTVLASRREDERLFWIRRAEDFKEELDQLFAHDAGSRGIPRHTTLRRLLSLVEFVDATRTQEDAGECLGRIAWLIPLDSSSVEGRVEGFTEEFEQCILDALPDTLACLAMYLERTLAASKRRRERDRISYLRECTRAIMTFIGLISERGHSLPRNVVSKLANLEILCE